MPRFCIVGLGNPGARYERTRHNIGFEWIDSVVSKLSLNSRDFTEKFQSHWLKTTLKDDEIHFLKPQTYMNESGKAVASWLDKFQGDSKVLVVFDDMDLELGRIRLRGSGSDGGHRGLRSIIEHMGTNEVSRLRIGIGRPVVTESVEHVLDKFVPAEIAVMKKILESSLTQLEAWIKLPIEQAMGQVNGLKFI